MVMVMLAPATTAFVVSLTVPVISAVGVCGQATDESRNKHTEN